MDWTLMAATFVLGLVLGYMVKTLLSRNDGNEEYNKLAQQAQLELSQYKQEVTDQCAESYGQLFQLTEQLNKVNQSWNDAITNLQLDSETKPLPVLQQATNSATEDKSNK